MAGFLWLLDQAALVRSIERDHEPDYMIRSLRFVKWLADSTALAPEPPGADKDSDSTQGDEA